MYYCKLPAGFGISYYPAGGAAVRDEVATNPPKLKEKRLFQNLLLYLRKQSKTLKISFWREKPFPAGAITLSTGEHTSRGAWITSLGITACAGVSLSPSLVWRCSWICYILKSQGYNTCRVSFVLGLHLSPVGRGSGEGGRGYSGILSGAQVSHKGLGWSVPTARKLLGWRKDWAVWKAAILAFDSNSMQQITALEQVLSQRFQFNNEMPAVSGYPKPVQKSSWEMCWTDDFWNNKPWLL